MAFLINWCFWDWHVSKCIYFTFTLWLMDGGGQRVQAGNHFASIILLTSGLTTEKPSTMLIPETFCIPGFLSRRHERLLTFPSVLKFWGGLLWCVWFGVCFTCCDRYYSRWWDFFARKFMRLSSGKFSCFISLIIFFIQSEGSLAIKFGGWVF